MKQRNIGVIGGSGIYQIDSVETLEEINIETPFGKTSGPVMKAKLAAHEFYFIARHGKGHYLTPSEVNYRANIFALKKLGVNTVISVSAVGSLKEELPPRKIVLPDQFIDWTKGFRERSFFGEGMVGHVSSADPIEKVLQQRIAEVCQQHNIDHSTGGSYICIEGPQFSSRAESHIYRSFGASVIGMTNVPEAYLAKEAAMAYATIALVTDYDCWKEEHCTVEEILKVLGDNHKTAQTLLENLIPSLANEPIEFEAENAHALLTKDELLNNKHKDILEVLLS